MRPIPYLPAVLALAACASTQPSTPAPATPAPAAAAPAAPAPAFGPGSARDLSIDEAVAARYDVDARDGFLRVTPRGIANPPLWFATTAEPSASLADVEACAGGADGFWTGFFQGVDPQFTFTSAQHGPLQGRSGCFSAGPAGRGAHPGAVMVTFRFEVDQHEVTAACMFGDPQQQDVCRELLAATRVAP